jgi:hypothetical protein
MAPCAAQVVGVHIVVVVVVPVEASWPFTSVAKLSTLVSIVAWSTVLLQPPAAIAFVHAVPNLPCAVEMHGAMMLLSPFAAAFA